MASSRKNRVASPRNKAGIGAARAASQARSLPDEAVIDPPVSTGTDDAIETATVFTDAESKPIVESPIAENPIVEASAPEDILEAEITTSVGLESNQISEATVISEIVLQGIAVVTPEPAAPPQEAPQKSTATSTPRNKSKVSNPKSSVQRPKGDKTMTQETEKSAPLATKKETAIAKTGSALPVRPVTPSELTVVGMISSAGERPIGAATMAVFGTYLNGRPIEASSLKLFEILPGDRPVFATEIAYVPGTPLGGRPIMVSPAGLLGAEEVMGNRPIFSNEVDPDSASLMGYLD
jgi:hypothetical protein